MLLTTFKGCAPHICTALAYRFDFAVVTPSRLSTAAETTYTRLFNTTLNQSLSSQHETFASVGKISSDTLGDVEQGARLYPKTPSHYNERKPLQANTDVLLSGQSCMDDVVVTSCGSMDAWDTQLLSGSSPPQ